MNLSPSVETLWYLVSTIRSMFRRLIDTPAPAFQPVSFDFPRNEDGNDASEKSSR